MAGSTTRGYRYPTTSDAMGAIPAKVQQLAEDVDSKAGTMRRGDVTVGSMPAAGTPKSQAVLFATPFPSGVIPTVVVCSRSSTPQARYTPSVTAVSETGFTVTVANVSGSSDYPLTYIAIG